MVGQRAQDVAADPLRLAIIEPYPPDFYWLRMVLQELDTPRLELLHFPTELQAIAKLASEPRPVSAVIASNRPVMLSLSETLAALRNLKCCRQAALIIAAGAIAGEAQPHRYSEVSAVLDKPLCAARLRFMLAQLSPTDSYAAV